MKNFQNKLITLLFIILAFPDFGFSQDNLTNELRFEVNRIYPYILITKEELNEANSLTDLNRHYKSSWIREYISVEILTSHNGKIMKSVSKNGTLSQEQKNRMNMSDAGANISIKVKYIPENTLTHNDPKEINFTFTLDPESEAKYPGGQEQLKKYLKEKAIDKIPGTSFRNYDLTAIKFTISEEGEVINAHVFGSEYQTSENEKIDKLLLETIRNMPCWKPAEYSNGIKVKQEFVLTVGNMENCMIHLLNIQRDGLPRNG
ncbi:MAG: energy transducer TonB [Phaeodactylibacter sp.]|nr:energy transducer TonB [Phaeodactylibacter sp.]